jgi:hypothetical protein
MFRNSLSVPTSRVKETKENFLHITSNYQSALRNIPEEWRFHLHRRSLKAGNEDKNDLSTQKQSCCRHRGRDHAGSRHQPPLIFMYISPNKSMHSHVRRSPVETHWSAYSVQLLAPESSPSCNLHYSHIINSSTLDMAIITSASKLPHSTSYPEIRTLSLLAQQSRIRSTPGPCWIQFHKPYYYYYYSISTTTLSWVLACSTVVEHSQQEGFYRVLLPAAHQTPNLEENQGFRAFQLSPQEAPSVWSDASEPSSRRWNYGPEMAEKFCRKWRFPRHFWVLLRAVKHDMGQDKPNYTLIILHYASYTPVTRVCDQSAQTQTVCDRNRSMQPYH